MNVEKTYAFMINMINVFAEHKYKTNFTNSVLFVIK